MVSFNKKKVPDKLVHDIRLFFQLRTTQSSARICGRNLKRTEAWWNLCVAGVARTGCGLLSCHVAAPRTKTPRKGLYDGTGVGVGRKVVVVVVGYGGVVRVS